MGKTYDKVSWHFPDGKNCPSFEAAKAHFDVLMEWLQSRRLLSEEGQEAMDIGVDSDFSLTSYMLTDRGNDLLTARYTEWVRTMTYGEKQPSMDALEDWLRRNKVSFWTRFYRGIIRRAASQ